MPLIAIFKYMEKINLLAYKNIKMLVIIILRAVQVVTQFLFSVLALGVAF